MPKYNHKAIERKWQKFWEKENLFTAANQSEKPKYYCLIEFPYPSGEGLHVGHPRSYVALDILALKRKLEGYNVLYPIGFDAFGLPSENYAIKTGIHPAITTKKNIAKFTKQLKSLGLAFEEVVNGRCERCGTEVKKKEKEQWMLKITKYADRLLNDLETVDYLERIKLQQKNWIGRSEGTIIKFQITNAKFQKNFKSQMPNFKLWLEVFTTRPDTLFGATFMVIAPEHKIISNLKSQISNLSEVENYLKQARKKSDLERTDLTKEKTGVEIKGIKAINPVNNKEIPIFVADYILATYGTGAIMAVPAHDQRDWDFAKKYNLPIIEVISGGDISTKAFTEIENGKLINSGQFNNLSAKEAINKITAWLEKKDLGKKTVNYKLRDWVFSRQRYWGEPIPLIFCESCKKLREKSNLKSQISNLNQGEILNPGWTAIAEKDLPVKLPRVKKYEPTDTGETD